MILDNDKQLKMKELAAAYGVSYRTIRRWRAEGLGMINYKATMRGLLTWLHKRDIRKGRNAKMSTFVRS